MTNFRMVRADLLDKLAFIIGPLHEIGADNMAAIVQAVVASPECPQPAWPESLHALNRVSGHLRDFLVVMAEEGETINKLSEALAVVPG